MKEKELETKLFTAINWEHLINLIKFLKFFRYITKANEGLCDFINKMLPSLEFLLAYLER